MKILLINNYHYRRSGAEKAYFDTAEILRAHGHEVAFYSTKHDKNEETKWAKYFVENVDYDYADKEFPFWKKIKIAQSIIFNFKSKRNLEKLIQDFKPDIAHLHNVYHNLSPSIIYALKEHRIPIILTLHDYKLISPNYNLFLDGKIWEKKSVFSCVKDKCIKNSYLKSCICALEKILHDFLGSYQKIDAFISPSKFLIKKFTEFNFPKRIEFIPNPIEINHVNSPININSDGPLVFHGRLSKEKGIDVAIKAMELLEGEEKLWIVGDGPEKENLEKMIRDLELESSVKLLGFKSGRELQEILEKTKAILVPSIWYENMPYSIVESLALGKIVIASNIGGIPDLISDKLNGFLFFSGSSEDLAKKIRELKSYDLIAIKNNAKNKALEWNKEKYYKKILYLYKSLIKKGSA